MIRRAVALVAGAVPALFWLAYAAWNVVWTEPPVIAGATPFHALYAAMLPGVLLAAWQGRASAWPGRGAYVVFLLWVVGSLAWAGSSGGVEVSKRLLIYGLLGLTASQLAVSPRGGLKLFAISVLAVAGLLSLWTIGHALATGFAYRAGVPGNPNLPATLTGAGAIVAGALHLRRDSARWRRLALAIGLLSLYACLLLGSRGVLLALLAGGTVVVWQARPRLATLRPSLVGAVAVLVLAQMPAIPHRLWVGTLAGAEWVAARLEPSPEPAPAIAVPVPDGRSVVAAADVPPLVESRSMVGRLEVPAPAELTADAASSTAISRFGEQEAASFNLRWTLWTACLNDLLRSPSAFLFGGGMGRSQVVSHTANPVFASSHNAILQVVVDFGVIGLALFALFHAQIARRLRGLGTWPAAAGMGAVVYWLVVGLTATATDMHVYWVALGAAACAVHVTAADGKPQ